MLTPAQKLQIAKDAGFSFEKFHDREEVAAYNYGAAINIHDETMDAIAKAYAAGAKDMQELLLRTQKLMNALLLDDESSASIDQVYEGIAINYAIWALETT